MVGIVELIIFALAVVGRFFLKKLYSCLCELCRFSVLF